ncbi:hypothetical protein D3C73_686250 [compost metagenome]
MSGIEEITEISQLSQMFIRFCEILRPISMVSVLREFRVYIKVNVINNWCNPDCIYAEIFQIRNFLSNPFKIPTVISFQMIRIVILSVWIVITCISVKESVCQHKINACFIPIKIITTNNLTSFYSNRCILNMLVSIYIHNCYG